MVEYTRNISVKVGFLSNCGELPKLAASVCIISMAPGALLHGARGMVLRLLATPASFCSPLDIIN